ncbi:uncharacterized protein [Ptychodera flava]|uniref:uncharacterized protein n=1 Tax=Ptychodera flava TaxID=63121 RepID=UPI00396A40E8
MAIKSPSRVDRTDSTSRASKAATNEKSSRDDDYMKYSIQVDEALPIKYEKAMKRVPSESIKSFARKLKLANEDIEDIYHEQSYMNEIRHSILKKWIQEQGDEATEEVFVRALRSERLNSVVDDIFKEKTCSWPQHQGSMVFSWGSASGHDTGTSYQTGSDPLTIFSIAVIFIAAAVTLTYWNEMTMFALGMIAAFAACLYYYSSNTTDPPPSLRKPSRLFTGKAHTECLKAISKHLDNHRKTAAAQRKVFVEVLYGLGGCGKTEIMCSYVWENWKRYKGGVYFLNGKSNSCLDYGFMQILKKMRLKVREEEKNPTLIRWTVFNKLREKKDWLLVIDDADDPDLIQQMLMNMYDLDGHILITSRAERGWLDQVKPTMTPVPLFSKEDSAIYLLRHTRSDEGKLMSFEEATEQLKKLESEDHGEYKALMWLGGEEGLHGLPLALRQASKYLCQHPITFDEYKQSYITHQIDVIQSWERGDPLLWWFKSHGLKEEYAKNVQEVAGKNMMNLQDLSKEQWQEISKTMSSEDLEMLEKAIKETPYVEFVQMNVLSRENVVTTWKMNYESLAKEEHVKQFLHLCACLGTNISVALLIDGVEHLNQGPLQRHLTSTGTISSCLKEEAHKRIDDLFLKMTEHSFTTIVGRSGKSTPTDNRYSTHTIHHLLQQVMFVHFLSREEKIESLNNAIRMLENLFPKRREVTGSASATVYDRHSVITLHTLAVCQQIRTLKKDEIDGLVNISPLFRVVSNYLLRLGRAEDA